jgi:hypothetical protein
MKPYWISNNLLIDMPDNLSEVGLRKYLLNTVSIVSHSHVDIDLLFDKNNFVAYLTSLQSFST